MNVERASVILEFSITSDAGSFHQENVEEMLRFL